MRAWGALLIILACVFAIPAEAHARHHHYHRHSHHHVHLNRRFEAVFTPAARGPLAFQPGVFGRPAPFDPFAHGFRSVERSARVIFRGTADVLREGSRFLGAGNITGHRGPWCKFFVNLVLMRTGHHWQASGRAIDVRLLGPRTYAHAGAIAYTPHHTGFVAEVDARHGRVLLLGGNQNHHRVSLSWHSMRGMRFVTPA